MAEGPLSNALRLTWPRLALTPKAFALTVLGGPVTLNPYQPPAVDISVTANAHDGETTLATRGERFAAAWIDGMISLVVLVPLQFAFGRYDGFPKIRDNFAENLLWRALGFVFWTAINLRFLKNAQTIGKRALGLQVVTFAEGRPIPASKYILVRALPTHLIGLIPVIGIYLASLDPLFIFGSTRRCFHDAVAGTKVVKLPKVAPSADAAAAPG
jgi:uncharacterized RDD family membrane protein YckC